jgi:SdrD B-like domain
MHVALYNRVMQDSSMTTSTLARVLTVILAFVTLCAHRSLACSCGIGIGRPGNCSDLKVTGPSFVGTVIDIQNPPDERRGVDQGGLSRYRFRVDENINGFDVKEVDVYSGRGGADCSYHFEMGRTYFVTPFKGTAALMALYGAEPGKLMAGICTETQPVASAGALLAELRARKRGSTIEGVLRTKQQQDEYDHGMPNITVELLGKDNTLSTKTDIDGVYRFTGVPPGEYKFAVKLPPDFPRLENKPGDNSSSITITDQACYTRDINALTATRVEP